MRATLTLLAPLLAAAGPPSKILSEKCRGCEVDEGVDQTGGIPYTPTIKPWVDIAAEQWTWGGS